MTIGERMKKYEKTTDISLIPNSYCVIRLDGRAFHTLTKGMDKPFDDDFSNLMQNTMIYLCQNISNCVFGYTQSDEITLILKDANWFDYRVCKILTIISSMATLWFNKLLLDIERFTNKRWQGVFDARIFNLPNIDEVVNNIIWRQEDATKNSINAVARKYFDDKTLYGLKGNQKQDLLFNVCNINWNDYPIKYKRGICCYKQLMKIITPNGDAIRNKWLLDFKMPIIKENKDWLIDVIKGGSDVNIR